MKCQIASLFLTHEPQQNSSNKWARGLLPWQGCLQLSDKMNNALAGKLQIDEDLTWQKWKRASKMERGREVERETGGEVGQRRIISTALSSVKSMVVKLQVRAGWAALSLTAECVLGNNPLLTSSTCHWGNAPFVTIYTAAELSG